jgi:hypothetical protein
LIPTKGLDIDRLNEEKEDFMSLDKRRNLSQDFEQGMAPKPEICERRILGTNKVFQEGKELKIKLELSKNTNTGNGRRR